MKALKDIAGSFFHDDVYRIFFSAYGAFAGNLIFAVVKGYVGWQSGSYWLITLACYHLLLCFIRLVLLKDSRKLIQVHDENVRMGREWRAYQYCGIMFMVLTIVLEGTVVLIMINGDHYAYEGYLIYAVALYDFYCLIVSIVYVVRKRRRRSPIVMAVAMVRLETSMVSMLSLQTAMFASFGDEMAALFQNTMNMATGSIVCVLTFVLGLMMVIKAGRMKRTGLLKVTR